MYVHISHIVMYNYLAVSGAPGVTGIPSWEIITYDSSEETDSKHWSLIWSGSTESIKVTLWPPSSPGQQGNVTMYLSCIHTYATQVKVRLRKALERNSVLEDEIMLANHEVSRWYMCYHIMLCVYTCKY